MDDFTDTKSQEKQTLQFVFLEELFNTDSIHMSQKLTPVLDTDVYHF